MRFSLSVCVFQYICEVFTFSICKYICVVFHVCKFPKRTCSMNVTTWGLFTKLLKLKLKLSKYLVFATKLSLSLSLSLSKFKKFSE